MSILETENLVSFKEGNIPVLITVPHGGTKKPEDIHVSRTESKGYKPRDTEKFSTQCDENTYEMGFRLAEKLKEKIGLQPYFVAAEFDRKYVDVNRDNRLLGPMEIPHENHAYDSPVGQKYYDFYHEKIRQYVADIRHHFKNEGLLFDIHGSVLQDNKIVVGMVLYDPADFQRYFRRGHVSVDRLLDRFGTDPLYHTYSGFLTAMNGKPLPGDIQTEVVPTDRFQRASPAGGFTVITYGSNRPKGINAFHLECSRKLRTLWLGHTEEIYSDAILTLYRNIIDAPFINETIFAGKKEVIGCGKSKPESVAIEFSLNYSPRKDYPFVVIVHTRNSFNCQNKVPVILNDQPIGEMVLGKSVSMFEVENKGWCKLSKKKNLINICITKQGDNDNGSYFGFEVVKVSIVYCYATF